MQYMNLLRRAFAALGLSAVLASCATGPNSAPVANSARPALWRVSDADTNIYLFGTIHLLPPGYQWQTPAIQSALAKSSDLTVETLIDDKHPEVYTGVISKIGFAPGLPPLADRISPALRPKLTAALTAAGLPVAYADKMKTWFAAFAIVQSQFKTIGLKGEAGVEPSLRQSFESAGKPVGQLETLNEQLSFLDTLSLPAQRQFLEGAISDPEKMRSEFDAMLKSWSSGDVAGMAKSFNADLADVPELRTALLTRRNQNWSRWIERRMQQPGTSLVAVGAGHLAGDESVIAMLQRDGYKVTRVE